MLAIAMKIVILQSDSLATNSQTELFSSVDLISLPQPIVFQRYWVYFTASSAMLPMEYITHLSG